MGPAHVFSANETRRLVDQRPVVAAIERATTVQAEGVITLERRIKAMHLELLAMRRALAQAGARR